MQVFITCSSGDIGQATIAALGSDVILVLADEVPAGGSGLRLTTRLGTPAVHEGR